jgi:FkbM family methyltransferase
VLQRFWKPWYVWRPWQLVVRAVRALSAPQPGYRLLRTTWGGTLLADPTKTIGRSIWTTGLYDLAVSEILARLIRPGDVVLDAGANVGYMTLLAAAAAGPSGRVLSFEPHPELFEILQRNAALERSSLPLADIHLRNVALGEEAGTAELVLPSGMAHNDGIAYIARDGSRGERSVPVAVEPLDGVLGTGSAAVLKVDVEGYELPVLRGAGQALAGRRIRHILFEDHHGADSPAGQLLLERGYRLFAIGWSIRGPKVAPAGAGKLAADYEAPSYLATLEAEETLRRCAAPGWLVLSRRWLRRRRDS